eukprot:31386-Pelagococcus_subviridis.AAC.5
MSSLSYLVARARARASAAKRSSREIIRELHLHGDRVRGGVLRRGHLAPELHRRGLDLLDHRALDAHRLGDDSRLVRDNRVDGGGVLDDDRGGRRRDRGVEVREGGRRGHRDRNLDLGLEGVVVELVRVAEGIGRAAEEAGDRAADHLLEDEHGDEADHRAAAVRLLRVDRPGLARLERRGVSLVAVRVLHAGHEGREGDEAGGEGDRAGVRRELGRERLPGGELRAEAGDEGDLRDAAVDRLRRPRAEGHGVLERLELGDRRGRGDRLRFRGHGFVHGRLHAEGRLGRLRGGAARDAGRDAGGEREGGEGHGGHCDVVDVLMRACVRERVDGVSGKTRRTGGKAKTRATWSRRKCHLARAVFYD